MIDLTNELLKLHTDIIYDRPGWHPNAQGAKIVADFDLKNIETPELVDLKNNFKHLVIIFMSFFRCFI